jgi:hypothetical protein
MTENIYEAFEPRPTEQNRPISRETLEQLRNTLMPNWRETRAATRRVEPTPEPVTYIVADLSAYEQELLAKLEKENYGPTPDLSKLQKLNSLGLPE